MRNLQRGGAIASLLNASIAIANMVVVFGLLGAEVTNHPTLVAEQVRLQPLPLLLLEFFKILSAIATLFVVLAIHQRLKHHSSRSIQFATRAGVVSVFLLLVAGTVGAVAITLANLGQGAGQDGSMPTYETFSMIINGLGLAAVFANGIWYLLVSFAAIRTPLIPRTLGYVGVPLGAACLIAFVFPPVALLVLVLSLIWSAWLGVFLLRTTFAERADRTTMVEVQARKQLKRNSRSWLTGAFLLALLLALPLVLIERARGSQEFIAPDYPTQGWRSSTPEEQGIDSARLAEGLLAVRQKNIPIHSLLLIRNGRVVVDANFYPYDGKTVHDLASVTKTLMTTLIGIAADQGKLELDASMVSFFPERTIANRDARKERITVRHLASMSSGLDCTAAQDELTLQEMMASPDWVQFVLDRKAADEPGSRFVYCSPGMHLLSAILQKATGQTALEFARENLFEPLGVQNVIWPADPQGITRGWGSLHLNPRDAAKIGYLWLNGGVWDGKQIVSRAWVESSIKPQIQADQEADYGYGWWVNTRATPPFYEAQGRGGQRITVVPSLNMIVVMTGEGFEPDDVATFLLPALVDMLKPLPDNPKGVVKLNEALSVIAEAPAPTAVAPLPETATIISGKIWTLDPNSKHLRTLRLDFNDSAEANLTFTFDDGTDPRSGKIGLDGIYRFSSGENNLPLGQRGYWADEQTFVLDYNAIANLEAFTVRMHFSGTQVVLEAYEHTYGSSITIYGRLQDEGF